MIQLLNIDCMEYMKGLDDNAFDLIVTDPPYGINLNYNSYEDTRENWEILMNQFIPSARRVANMVIMTSGGIDKLPWIYQNHPPDWLIAWDKGSPGHLSKVGFNDWESLPVYGRVKGSSIHDLIRMGNDVKMGDFEHPCPKPVRWFRWFYGRMPKPLKVIDPFMGSGTSAIAAHYLGVDYVGCEIDKDYYDAAVNRFNQETAQLDIFG